MPSADPQTSTTLPEQSQESAPVAPTPGPRATAFLNLYQKTLDITLRNVSYENFAACFPTIAANAPENLRGMHAAMIERLEKFAQKDFSALLTERNVITNLNALEELLADASRRRARAVEGSTPPTPPHLLAPSQILEAHLAPQLASQQSQLNAKLQTTQSQNAALFRTIQGQKAEIETLLDGLENTVRDLEDANAKLGGEVPGLRSVVRDVEAEMADI